MKPIAPHLPNESSSLWDCLVNSEASRMMSHQPQAFSLESLKHVEHVYRQQLVADPGDMMARISLAWCLFMQALHRAGQESIVAELAVASEGQGEELNSAIRSILDEDADNLLKECMRQTITVMQLSSDPQDHTDAEKLQALIKLSGGGKAVSEAQAEGANILAEVTRQILNQGENSGKRLRRLPTRRHHPQSL